MRRIFLRGFILLPVFMLQGCALPVPIQVASWIIDGISYLATEKSVAEHGVSFVAQKDCALWRGLKGENFCLEDIEGIYALWDTDESGDSGALAENSPPAPGELEGAPEDLADFETAAGAPDGEPGAADAAPTGSLEEAALPAAPVPEATPPEPLEAADPVPMRLVAARLEIAAPEAVPGIPETLQPETPLAAVPEPVFNLSRFFQTLVRPADPPGTEQSGGDDMYYVIGSFRRIIEAERLAEHHFNLEPAVIVAIQNGRKNFRVVVGPYTQADEDLLRRAISRTGLSNIWAMRFDPVEWELSPLRSRDVAELP